MRRFWTLVAALAWLLPADPASATMILGSYDQTKNDRFYVGADKDFIGDPYDWSGVGRNNYWGTMISDSYFLSSNHYHPAVGTSLTFYWTNNPSDGSETRNIASGIQIAGSDLWLGKLSTPVSSHVTTYSILSFTDESSYDDLLLYTFGLSNKSPVSRNVRLGLNNLDPDSIQDVTIGAATGRVFLYDFDPAGGQGANESYLQIGDSGGPSLAIIDGQPVLVGIHWFTWDDGNNPPQTIGSGDTLVANYVNAINQAMVGEHLSLVPEPAALVLLGLATLCGLGYAARRRVMRRS
jgi:hypothetical protein